MPYLCAIYFNWRAVFNALVLGQGRFGSVFGLTTACKIVDIRRNHYQCYIRCALMAITFHDYIYVIYFRHTSEWWRISSYWSLLIFFWSIDTLGVKHWNEMWLFWLLSRNFRRWLNWMLRNPVRGWAAWPSQNQFIGRDISTPVLRVHLVWTLGRVYACMCAYAA